MQLQQLRYILEVADTGSINKAAKNLFVSQPNLSSAISNLEKELNVQIFNRNNKGVEITHEGRLLIQYANSILGQVDQLKKLYGIDDRKHVRYLEISQTGMVDITPVISKIYNDMKENKVQMIIKEESASDAIKHLHYMKSEVAIVTMNSMEKKLIEKILEKRKIEFNILFKTQLGIVVSELSSLYHKEEVPLEELSLLTYIEYLEENNFTLSYSGEMVETWGKFSGNTIHVTDRSMAYDLLKQSDSYSFNIEKNKLSLEEKGLKFIRLSETVDIYVAWLKRKREKLSYEASILVEELEKNNL